MIKKYHTSLLLTAITHFGCMHNQKLGMNEEGLSQEPAPEPIAVAFVDIDALAASAIANSTTMVDCAKFLTQRAVTCSGLTPIAAQDLPQRAIAFAAIRDTFAYKMAFENNNGNLMYQDVIEKFPELLITSPVSALPEPTNETAEAIRMYLYMIQLLDSPCFLKLRCALLCHPRYWPMPAIEKDSKYLEDLRGKFKYDDPSTIDLTENLIREFLPAFPHLLAKCLTERDLDHCKLTSTSSLPGQPLAFAKMMEKFVHSVAFGNNDIDLMYQHIIPTFPWLLLTSPVTSPVFSLPKPANEKAVAIAMYQYMIELVSSASPELRCTLLHQPGYWPKHPLAEDSAYRKNLHNNFRCGNLYTTDSKEPKEPTELIDKFLLKFPYLLIAPDRDTDIPLSNAILQDQTVTALRFLNLAEKAGMVEQMLNHQNSQGHTPFTFIPVSNSESAVVEKMLALDAASTVLVQDEYKRTVVHYCVVKNQPEKLTNVNSGLKLL